MCSQVIPPVGASGCPQCSPDGLALALLRRAAEDFSFDAVRDVALDVFGGPVSSEFEAFLDCVMHCSVPVALRPVVRCPCGAELPMSLAEYLAAMHLDFCAQLRGEDLQHGASEDDFEGDVWLRADIERAHAVARLGCSIGGSDG